MSEALNDIEVGKDTAGNVVVVDSETVDADATEPAELPAWANKAKAYVAGAGGLLLPFLTALAMILESGQDLSTVTTTQWLMVCIAGLGGGAGLGRAVYNTPNRTSVKTYG